MVMSVVCLVPVLLLVSICLVHYTVCVTQCRTVLVVLSVVTNSGYGDLTLANIVGCNVSVVYTPGVS